MQGLVSNLFFFFFLSLEQLKGSCSRPEGGSGERRGISWSKRNGSAASDQVDCCCRAGWEQGNSGRQQWNPGEANKLNITQDSHSPKECHCPPDWRDEDLDSKEEKPHPKITRHKTFPFLFLLSYTQVQAARPRMVRARYFNCALFRYHSSEEVQHGPSIKDTGPLSLYFGFLIAAFRVDREIQRTATKQMHKPQHDAEFYHNCKHKLRVPTHG